jgi:hypothetical protein
MCISISYGDGREINAWNICYNVEYKPGASSSVPTEYYTALTDAASRAAEFVGEANAAAVKAENASVNAANEVRNELSDYTNATMGYAEAAGTSAKASENSALQSASAANAALAESIPAIYERLIPIGYIFQWTPVEGYEIDLSTPQNVASHFGFGVWEQISERFILGCGESYPAGSFGGSKTHIMTVDEMPAHTHELLGVASRVAGTEWTGAVGTVNPTSAIDIGETGGSQPFDIMPPYVSAYIWKRIA